MTRIFIVEDHPVMRRGYASVIEAESDLAICGETSSAMEARQQIPETEVDLVLVDLSLEEGSGLALIKDLAAAQDDLPILVVSMHDETLYAHRALQAGARGYIMKSEADSTLVEAIRQVLEGQISLSADLRSEMLHQFVEGFPQQDSPLDVLSDRELEVLSFMGRGYERKEIAEALSLSPKTIDSYRDNLKEKLSVETNARLRRTAAIWMEMDFFPEE